MYGVKIYTLIHIVYPKTPEMDYELKMDSKFSTCYRWRCILALYLFSLKMKIKDWYSSPHIGI